MEYTEFGKPFNGNEYRLDRRSGIFVKFTRIHVPSGGCTGDPYDSCRFDIDFPRLPGFVGPPDCEVTIRSLHANEGGIEQGALSGPFRLIPILDKTFTGLAFVNPAPSTPVEIALINIPDHPIANTKTGY